MSRSSAWCRASDEMEVVVKEEEAGGFAGLDGEGGKGAVFVMELQHAMKVDGADDVDVMENEGLGRRVASIFQKEPRAFFEAAAGVKQEVVFARDFDAHAEIVVRLEVVDDHVSEMIDVDDDFADAKGAQARESDFEERAAMDLHQGFGAGVGEGAQARAQTGSEDHGLHTERFNTEDRESTEQIESRLREMVI